MICFVIDYSVKIAECLLLNRDFFKDCFMFDLRGHVVCFSFLLVFPPMSTNNVFFCAKYCLSNSFFMLSP